MTKSFRHLQKGFSLVELMISIVLGMFVVLALVALLININRNNTELNKSSRVIENGRFAVQMLAADISHAGFWGGFVPRFDDLLHTVVPNDEPTAVPDPCVPFGSWGAEPHTSATAVPPVFYRNNLLGIAVQAYEIPAAVPTPALPVCATTPNNIVTNPQPNTDVLVVRYVDGTSNCNPAVITAQENCPLPLENEIYLQTQSCGNSPPAVPYVLDRYTGANHSAVFSFQKRNCSTSAELRRFVSNLYYIRSHAVTAGDGIPTLMRSQFNGNSFSPAQPLVEGVQSFRVELGIDNLSDTGAAVNFAQAISWANPSNLTSPINRGDGQPDGNYIRCTAAVPCTAAQLMNVVAVRVSILARSENTTPGHVDDKTYFLGGTSLGPFNDGFKRHVFTQTIRLTNVSMRRETP